jgi:hypothetical protein
MDASRIGGPLFGRLGVSRGVVAGGLIAFLCLAWPPGMLRAESKAPQPPMEVTSDTPEYCLQLADRVNNLVEVAQAKPPQQVADLQVEGKRMCEHGQTRGGIMRLRQAILLMKHDDSQTNP